MEECDEKIIDGFTPGNKIFWYTWEGFGWFGKLQVELDGEYYVMDAGGTASGDHGDMIFKIFENISSVHISRILNRIFQARAWE